MPMNPRLLRPTSSTLDKDAAIYLNAVAVADGQQLEPAVRKAVNDFVVGCKQDGIWSAIKASCILAGARTLAGALTPLKGAAPTNNGPFVAGDYDRKTGLVGNGSTKFLDSGRAGNADPQDNAHLAVYASSIGGAGGAIYCGAGTNANGSHTIASRGVAATLLRSRSRSNILSSATSATDTAGFLGTSRSASDSFSLRGGGVTDSISQASQTPVTNNVFIFGGSATTTTVGSPSAARLAFYSIGESINLALLDARISAYYTAIGAAI